jgi:FKBP-type peptidyl-prolyl cis-trans isomerase
MKRNILILLFLGVAAFSLQAGKPKKSNLKTAQDSVSYALGMQVGLDLVKNLKTLPGEPLPMDKFIEAMSKALKGDTTNFIIDPANMNNVIQVYMIKAQTTMNEKTQEENKKFLETNKQKPGVKTTASGLQYEVIQEGTGVMPKATDKVRVNYHGTLVDGTVFDSSIERGTPLEFELNKVIPGWTEGLQLMKVGSKYRFYLSPELGYGARSMGKIKPYSILIFEVELLDVAKPTASQNGAQFQFDSYQRSNSGK